MKKNYTIKYKFPKKFLWGTATAAHQVEGHNTNSDWWGWEKRKKSIPDSGRAISEYKHFKHDINLIKDKLNNNSFRLSIEWARIEPKIGVIKQKEIDHYKQELQKLKENGIKTLVTIHHFTSPKWFADMGGWENSKNIKYFLDYVKILVENFKDYVDFWIVVNEPNVYSSMSYLLGLWPPEKRSLVSTLKVYKNLISAHKQTYVLIHKMISYAKVGTSINMVCYKGKNILEKIFSKLANYVYNYSFIEFSKNYWDFIGINFYFLHFVTKDDLVLLRKANRSIVPAVAAGLRGEVMWPNYPEGLYLITQAVWKKYKKPIIITENGLASNDDRVRKNFILNSLIWLNRSIDAGAEVLGYFYWSFADNIEWAMGQKIKFGLFSVDYSSMERTMRESAKFYSEVAKNNEFKI